MTRLSGVVPLQRAASRKLREKEERHEFCSPGFDLARRGCDAGNSAFAPPPQTPGNTVTWRIGTARMGADQRTEQGRLA